MSTVAFTLRDEYAGTVVQREDENDEGREVPVFTGGLITVSDQDFDVRAELDAGDGYIVVASGNAALVDALDNYPALKRAASPDGAPIASGYDSLKVSDLRAELKRRGVEPGNARKDALVRALTELDLGETPTHLDDLEGDQGDAGEGDADTSTTSEEVSS